MIGQASHSHYDYSAANIRSHNLCDKSFIEMVEEIQREYIKFSKPERIRIERWIEKLVSVVSVNFVREQNDFAGNLQWRRERNLYTKNLLDCVIKRSLREPFHALPPNGPLMQLPSHIRLHSKSDLVGVHELSFWRDVRMSLNGNEPPVGESAIDPASPGATPRKTSMIGVTPSKTPLRAEANLDYAHASGNKRVTHKQLLHSQHKLHRSASPLTTPHSPRPLTTFHGQGGPADPSPRDLFALKDIIREQSNHIHVLEERIAQQQLEHGHVLVHIERLLAAQGQPLRRPSAERASRARRSGSPSDVDAFLQYLEDFQSETKSMLRLTM